MARNGTAIVKGAQQGMGAGLVDGFLGSGYSVVATSLLCMLRNQQDAEDAVQRAFQRALANLKRLRGDSAFSTWITRVVQRARRSNE
jgi:NAD(P)-dependent dehydrogenase (short-subunit alcohol dehydrogenase family)